MFMQKLRTSASTETSLLTSLPKRNQKKNYSCSDQLAPEKNFTGIKLNTLISKNNNNKFLLLCLMPVGFFCNDDRTPLKTDLHC